MLDLKKIKNLLVLLISSLVITGSSFIDGAIWDIIFAIIGTLTYSFVGTLYSIRLLHGKKMGRDAYVIIFILLALGAYTVYQALIKFILWINSWQLFIKILVPSILFIIIVAIIILIVLYKKGKVFSRRIDESKKDDSNIDATIEKGE